VIHLTENSAIRGLLLDLINRIKSGIMRWAPYVEGGSRRDVNTDFSWGYLRKRDYLEDLSVDGRTLL
jgi:hypothetical protein